MADVIAYDLILGKTHYSGEVSYTESTEIVTTVTTGTSNQSITIADYANLILISSSQAITVKLNSSSGTAIPLDASSPLFLSGTNITALYISNASGSSATVTIKVYGGTVSTGTGTTPTVFSDPVTFNGTVTINGATVITSPLTVVGATSLTGALTLVGSPTITGNPAITGTTTHTGAVTITGDMGVTGTTTLTGPLNVGGAVTITGATGITGATTLTGAVGITGITTQTGNLNITGDVNIIGGLYVSEGVPYGQTYFDVKAYGAKGDGTTEDSAAILAAFTAQQTAQSGRVFFPPGRYYVKPNLVVPQITYDVVVEGENATLFCKFADYAGSGAEAYVFYPWATYSATVVLAADIAKGATTITVADSSAMSVGDGIMIYSYADGPIDVPDYYYHFTDAPTTYYKCHMSEIVKVPGATSIVLADPTPHAFACSTKDVSMHVYTANPRISISGLAFEWTGTHTDLTNDYTEGLVLDGFFHPTLDNIQFFNTAGYGVKTISIYGGVFNNISGRTAIDLEGYGYGIGALTNFNTSYNNCNIWASRHAIALTGNPSCDVSINNCNFQSQGSADGRSFDSHIAHRAFINGCFLPNATKHAGGEHYFHGCYIGNGGEGTNQVFLNRATVSTQEIFEVKDCFIHVYKDYPIWSTVSGEVAGVGFNNFGAIRFIDNVIVNHMEATIQFFGGAWHVDTINEICVENNKLTSDNAYGLAIWTTATMHHLPSTYGTFICRNNDFKYGSVVGTVLTSGPGVAPYNRVVGDILKDIGTGTAAPTTGAWKVGDRVWNSAPASGNPIGWMCTVAGTPGTWNAMSNLV